ncbi:MAG: MFS transporter [Planctomycetaceae bacterium]
MIFGILGHVARFLVYALYPHPAVAVSINILHGICYAFYFATVYLFIDEFFPKDAVRRAQDFQLSDSGSGGRLWAISAWRGP